jgi:outer membrane receptor protein involved in Fe transport
MAKFQLRYLDGTLLQLRINTEYKNTKGLSLGAGIELNDYSIQKSLVAYALPTFIGSAHAAHVYKNKCTSQIYIHYYNSTKALRSLGTGATSSLENINVAGFFNVDLKFAYQITKPLGGFLQVQNLLNQKNPVFYNYSSRGILFMIGASYRF